MKKAGLLCCCLALYSVTAFGGATVGFTKDSLKRSVGLTFSYQPYDFFFSAQYSGRKGMSEHSFRLGTGVNRTIFQGRIFPRASAQLSFHLLTGRLVQTGVMVRTDVSLVDVDRNAAHGMHFFEEITPGLFIGTGRRFHCRLTAGFGPAWEQTWSDQNEGYRTWSSWSQFVELSCSYAL